MTVLRNNYRIGLNVDDYWSLSTLESGRQSDECEACLSQTRHETYTSVTLGAVGIIIVLVVSFVFLHFSSNPSPPGIKSCFKRLLTAGSCLVGVVVENNECTSSICARQWFKAWHTLLWVATLDVFPCSKHWVYQLIMWETMAHKLKAWQILLAQLTHRKCSVVQNI